MKKDLTVIYITANETPPGWEAFHRGHIENAIADLPVINITRKLINYPGVNLLDTNKKSYANIYRQLLRGAKMATTEFVAMAEDDTLYSPDHFRFFRPKPDEVAYNMSKWSLYTWDPRYSLKRRKTNAALIAPRAYLIEALEERFEKYHGDNAGEVGRHLIERSMGVKLRNAVEVYSEVPIIQVSHPNGTEDRQRSMRKKLGAIKAYDIPYWGSADDIIKQYR